MFGWLVRPLALASTVAISTLGVFSQRYQRARFFFHVILYISTLGAVSVWGLLVSVLASLAGQVSWSFHQNDKPIHGVDGDGSG